MRLLIGIMTGFLSLILTFPAAAQLRPMVYSAVTIERSADEAFADWTNAESLEAFFAAKAFIDPIPGGDYALWFAPDAPEGQRGSDFGRVIGVEQGRMISVTWDMPPYMPEIRPHQTALQILFEPIDKNTSRLRLFHTGFGESQAWKKGHDYFETVWPKVLSDYREWAVKQND